MVVEKKKNSPPFPHGQKCHRGPLRAILAKPIIKAKKESGFRDFCGFSPSRRFRNV
jgi:hypothetical protein